MFDTSDIICGILILGFILYILIDSYLLGKQIEKQRKERNAERIKRGEKPIDYDKPVGGSFSSSDARAADDHRSTIFRNMGGLS